MDEIEKTLTANRPWGHYEVLADERDHKVKRITVKPGARLSLQKHFKRAEVWTVISGLAQVTRDQETLNLKPGETVEIPRSAVHRISNPGNTDLVFIEVQHGDYFGEDDLIRLEDDYDRPSPLPVSEK